MDPVDRLLHQYYQAQVPENWPEAPRPKTRHVTALPVEAPSPAGRWAVAACAAVLVGTFWVASGMVNSDARPLPRRSGDLSIDTGSAKLPKAIVPPTRVEVSPTVP